MADVAGVGLVGADVLGAGVFLERVPDGEVAVGEDGATDLTLVALVVGRLMDDQVLHALHFPPAVVDGARPHVRGVDTTVLKVLAVRSGTAKRAPGERAGVPVRVDPHVKVLDEGVVARAKRRGLDALVYAPHFVRLPDIRERAARFSDDELLVVPGREVFTGSWRNRKHVLAVDLAAPVPDFVTLAGTMREFDRQGATVLVPHPEFLTVSLDAADLREYRDVVDAIEVYDPKLRAGHVERARELAREFDLPAFGSSYAHLRGSVGEAWTEFEFERGAEPADGSELATALAEAPRRVFHRPGAGHQLRRHAEFAHLAHENTWKKLDRVALSGREPTHPDAPAYGGRFDDVACY